ncbi:MAG TPA: manganese efflux pump, partial [Candidatus Tumulicola sp.]
MLRELAYITAIAIGANIDNLGAGFAYALSKRRIALGANLVIAAFSAVFALAGVLAGAALASHLPAMAPGVISGATFLALGAWAIFDLLRTPERDATLAIGGFELCVVAFGLSINAAAAGVAAGFGGHSAIALAAGIGFASFIAIELGRRFGGFIWRGPTRRLSQGFGALAFVTIGIFELLPGKTLTVYPAVQACATATAHHTSERSRL